MRGTCLYIRCEDIDGMLDSVTAAGGEIVQRKKKISDEYGYYGLFKDPHGTVVGLWCKT